MTRTLFAAAALFAASAVCSASAATLDFSGVQGNQGTQLILPEVTINSPEGGDILVGPSAAGQSDGFCVLSAVGSGCEADVEMVFTTAVENLSFDADGFNVGDFVTLSVYGIGNILSGTVNISANGNIDLMSFGVITRLFFDDSSTGAGFGYSTFVFDVAGTNEIPVPAALPLLLTGLAGLGFVGRRRRARI